MKKRGFTKGLDFDLKWGLKGLRISLIFLIVVTFSFSLIIVLSINSLSEVIPIVLRKPDETDLLAFFAGVIIFVALPFLLGVKIGIDLESKRH